MISIAMPTFNRGYYLSETIDSIIAQSYKEWELIVVDDGSTDGTDVLMDYYTKLDKRIKYIKLPKNRGISYARNTAIRASKGEYIAVMDSDDVMVVDRLKVSLKAIKDNDFVYSSYGIFDGSDNIGVHTPPKKVTFEDIRNNGSYPHVTIMAKRECFTENPYRDDLTANDDAWLVWKWFQAGYKAKFIKSPLVVVRQHNNRTSATKKYKKEIDRVQKLLDKEYAEWG